MDTTAQSSLIHNDRWAKLQHDDNNSQWIVYNKKRPYTLDCMFATTTSITITITTTPRINDCMINLCTYENNLKSNSPIVTNLKE
ncbi:hypothetical protein DERP_009609 [Dermatophagoides pteronyssinus]|uniref:Uncharacterized protein n=1 Tax=Dermatophagoides pteronyssinus TaxID=6956 RepID=A0ABQ8JAC2_DERPT|nr:hypothetical protein DERP_009609 [Dermatophagoides pteronyssinus]